MFLNPCIHDLTPLWAICYCQKIIIWFHYSLENVWLSAINCIVVIFCFGLIFIIDIFCCSQEKKRRKKQWFTLWPFLGTQNVMRKSENNSNLQSKYWLLSGPCPIVWFALALKSNKIYFKKRKVCSFFFQRKCCYLLFFTKKTGFFERLAFKLILLNWRLMLLSKLWINLCFVSSFRKWAASILHC